VISSNLDPRLTAEQIEALRGVIVGQDPLGLSRGGIESRLLYERPQGLPTVLQQEPAALMAPESRGASRSFIPGANTPRRQLPRAQSAYQDNDAGYRLPESAVTREPLPAASASGTLSNTVQPGQGSMLPRTRGLRDRAAGLYEQGYDLYNRDPDTSALQAFARQRAQQGEGATLAALAAQYAGEGYQPLQQQLLKSAADAREAMKVGGGILTSEGQYIKDPFAAQDKRAEFLLQQAKAYEQMAATAETQEEQRAYRAMQNDINNQLRLMGLNIQSQNLDVRREQAQNSAEDRRVARQDREDRREEQRRNENNRAADTLRTEFLRRADKVREGTGHTQNVLQMLADPQTAKDPTRQVALIFSFGKMLDPESVVRESEYALIANARGLADTLQQLVPRLQSGARLSPQQLQSMQQVATNLMQGSTARAQDLDRYYEDLARRRNIDPRDVLPSYRGSSAGGGNVVDFNTLPK